MPIVRSLRFERPIAVLVVFGALVGLAGCTTDPAVESSPSTSIVSNLPTTSSATTSTERAGPSASELAIEADREVARAFIESNGGCDQLSAERCVANMLAFLMPESPALEPAVRATEREERELREYAAAVAQAEEDRKIIEYAAAVEKARVEEERRILEYAAAAEAAEKARVAEERRILRYAEAVAANEAREQQAIGIGEALLARQCPNGGQYVYWTDPPRAEVTQCYARQQTTSGQRTGAICRDGTRSSATGRGACSWHGGVDHWLY